MARFGEAGKKEACPQRMRRCVKYRAWLTISIHADNENVA
jgi:hypothetical protein